jgi:hypothetical protein
MNYLGFKNFPLALWVLESRETPGDCALEGSECESPSQKKKNFAAD